MFRFRYNKNDAHIRRYIIYRVDQKILSNQYMKL
jgi:hypothetical protein